jgi:LysR family transcriptional regulator, low CO2-responsive transcriptional regulator
MTLWQLKTFATVAREGSFTKAGKILQISQPSVSSLVIGLQKELGVKLFDKLGMKPHLTEAGRLLLKRAESVLGITEKIPEEMEEVKGLKKGRLRIGGSALAAASFLPMALQIFKKSYPGVEAVLKFQTGDNLEQMLLDGDLDFVIMSRRPRSRLLQSEIYREEPIVVIASPRHPLARRDSVPLRLLGKEQWILYTKGTPVREMIESKFADIGFSLTPALEVDVQLGARDAIKSAVAGGLGISLLSKCHVLSDIQAKRLKLIKVSGLNLKQTLYLTVHKTRQGSPLVEAFIDFLRHYSKN